MRPNVCHDGTQEVHHHAHGGCQPDARVSGVGKPVVGDEARSCQGFDHEQYPPEVFRQVHPAQARADERHGTYGHGDVGE